MSDPIPRLYTLDETSEILGVGRRTLNEWVSLGRIRVSRIGPRTPRVASDDLEAFIERSRLRDPVRCAGCGASEHDVDVTAGYGERGEFYCERCAVALDHETNPPVTEDGGSS